MPTQSSSSLAHSHPSGTNTRRAHLIAHPLVDGSNQFRRFSCSFRRLSRRISMPQSAHLASKDNLLYLKVTQVALNLLLYLICNTFSRFNWSGFYSRYRCNQNILFSLFICFLIELQRFFERYAERYALCLSVSFFEQMNITRGYAV